MCAVCALTRAFALPKTKQERASETGRSLHLSGSCLAICASCSVVCVAWRCLLVFRSLHMSPQDSSIRFVTMGFIHEWSATWRRMTRSALG